MKAYEYIVRQAVLFHHDVSVWNSNDEITTYSQDVADILDYIDGCEYAVVTVTDRNQDKVINVKFMFDGETYTMIDLLNK